jgi:hypothetical protein
VLIQRPKSARQLIQLGTGGGKEPQFAVVVYDSHEVPEDEEERAAYFECRALSSLAATLSR